MAFAGLYEWWRNKEVAGDDDPGAWLATCTIITTDAADYDAWLDPEHQDPDELRALLTAPADGQLSFRPVGTTVNSVRNNGPYLLDAETLA